MVTCLILKVNGHCIAFGGGAAMHRWGSLSTVVCHIWVALLCLILRVWCLKILGKQYCQEESWWPTCGKMTCSWTWNNIHSLCMANIYKPVLNGRTSVIKIRKNGLSSRLRCRRYILGELQLPPSSSQSNFGRASIAHPYHDASVNWVDFESGVEWIPDCGKGWVEVETSCYVSSLVFWSDIWSKP